MDVTTLIAKLQSDEGSRSLARVSVDALLARPMRDLVDVTRLRVLGRAVLEAWLKSPGAEEVITRHVETLVEVLQAEKRAGREVLPPDVRRLARELIARPFSPDRRVVLTIIDRPPTRDLVRELLLTAVLDFGRKASAPVAGMARGLGSLARLAGETVKARSGGLGSLVGAVGSEVERQLEKRAVEFVDNALAGVFAQIADALSDPSRADEAAELRAALFDGALELTGPQLAREVMNSDVSGGVRLLREGLSTWAASPGADEVLVKAADSVLAREGGKTGAQVLAEWGVLDSARELAADVLALHIRVVARDPAFAHWLGPG